jgi:predicted nucleic acid-binding protein
VIIVDTSVWSLAFRRRELRAPLPSVVTFLHQLIENDDPIGVPGMVLQELLAGVRDDAQARRLEGLMAGFALLLADRDQHMLAARIATACRKAGVAAATVDCLIAAQSITTHSVLLTVDEGFGRMSRHCELRLLSLPDSSL